MRTAIPETPLAVSRLQVAIVLKTITLGSNRVLGDVLVLFGAAFYAVSNVCTEFFVKNFSTVEFLGMLGIFGSAVSGLQL